MKIAIASGKGGTGKTTLSVNLAALLSEQTRIVLADLDVEEPNSGLFLNGTLKHEEKKYKNIPSWNKEECTLCGLCSKLCNFNAIAMPGDQVMVFGELCHSCNLCTDLCPAGALKMEPEKMGVLRHHKTETFDFIESKLDVGQEQSVPLIAQTLEYVDEHFDDTWIKLSDSPPGTSCPVIEATKESDFIILITEPTPFGLHDLKLAVETVRKLGKDFGIVINRHGIGDSKVEEYCEAENIEIISKIPNSRKIAEIYSRGELLYNKVPEFREAVRKVADKILKIAGEEK